jgi:hypothetical protein
MHGINAAVVPDSTNSTEHMRFYTSSESIHPVSGYDYVLGETFPYWITQVSSFSKIHLEVNRNLWTAKGLNMDVYIMKMNVTVMRYSELMENVLASTRTREAPLIVLIDTEGFDCKIIYGIAETTRYLPDYLLFEDVQCQSHPNRDVTYKHLQKLDYRVVKVKGSQNTISTRNHAR